MLDPGVKDEFVKKFSALAVFCSAMAGNVAVFAALSLLIASRARPAAAAGLLKTAFYILSALAIGAALRLRRRLLGDAELRSQAAQGAQALLEALMARHVVLFALWESLSVMGLVLAILSARPAEFWPFGAASTLGMILCWPRRDAWEKRSAALLGN